MYDTLYGLYQKNHKYYTLFVCLLSNNLYGKRSFDRQAEQIFRSRACPPSYACSHTAYSVVPAGTCPISSAA